VRSLTVAVIKKLAAPYVAEADRTPAVMELLAWGVTFRRNGAGRFRRNGATGNE